MVFIILRLLILLAFTAFQNTFCKFGNCLLSLCLGLNKCRRRSYKTLEALETGKKSAEKMKLKLKTVSENSTKLQRTLKLLRSTSFYY